MPERRDDRRAEWDMPPVPQLRPQRIARAAFNG
jgi:hypothetical protein